MWGKYGKSRILIARLHFSMMILWRQLRKDFYEVARGQHPLLSALSIVENLSCPKSIRSRAGTPIFQGQQYSSCSKAGGWRTAKLLGAFPRNLLIVSWVAPTPRCTANFPGNRCSQPLILRPFGRSGQELRVECQVEPFPTNFYCLHLKKGVKRGQDLGIY
jgi:hypothetical protein